MYAFPRLLFVILVMSMLGAGLSKHLHRDRSHRLGGHRAADARAGAVAQGKEFVESARALGAGFRRLLFRHVLPNALTPIVVSVTFGIPRRSSRKPRSRSSASDQSADAVVGSDGRRRPAILGRTGISAFFPSIAIAVTMLSFTFLGDGVRDALDPKLQ